MKILLSLILLIPASLLAKNPQENTCNTFAECTKKVLDAQSETKDALKIMQQNSENIKKLTEKLKANESEQEKIKNRLSKYKPGKFLKAVPIKLGTPGLNIPLGVNASVGFCTLNHIAGRFDNFTESISVYINNNQWHYAYTHGAARITGTIYCFSYPSFPAK